MRALGVPFAAVAFIAASAHAADELKFAPAPAWVVPQAIPSANSKSEQAPVAVLLNDSQVRLERGKVTSFTNLAVKVQTAEGLQAGNVTFAWQPSTDTVTVNRLHLIRDGKVIDVLKAGQTFTVARRETNMEAAVLDGTLTANIQPEGLQVGDVIDLAVTTERVDPVMKGHVETLYGGWNGVTIEKAHARISWPDELDLSTRQTAELPQAKRSTKDGWNILEVSAEGLEPLLLPKGAPLRFQIGRAGEATDFGSWSDLADLMAPMYRQAAVVPKSGPLRDELEKIRQTASTDKERAEKALQLVQDRVRYVALAMGMGGYVPAAAEETWSRRFGDCKAKTSLLVALLGELGIESDAVLVHSGIGDALPQLLPMVSYFDHVIARAKIGGKTYWLDGTRTGEAQLDRIPVPGFEWGLPLEPRATLVAIVQPPLAEPDTETKIAIDASAGIFAPAKFSVERTFRGDGARALHLVYSKMSGSQAEQMLREYWRGIYDYVTIGESSYAYDRNRAEMRLSMSGTAKLPWDDGWWYVPGSTIAYDADFDRASGKFQDAPFEIGFPSYESSRVTVQLPPGFGDHKLPPPVREQRAGVEYVRTAAIHNGALTVETSERAVQKEISHAEALAAKARLDVLYDDDIYLSVPSAYKATEADVAAQAAVKPASANGFARKGAILASSERYDDAIATFSEALALDPKNAAALAGRANALAAKEDFESAERDLVALDDVGVGTGTTERLRGHVFYSRNKLELADEAFSKALREDPRDVYSRLHRGLVRLEQDRPLEALADFEAVLAREPGNAQALAKRAAAYFALGDNGKALADSEAFVTSGSVPPEHRLLRANLFRRQGKDELVIKEADLLIAENPTSGYALVAAGKIFSAAGRRDKAIEAFDRALAVERAAYVYINRSQVRAPDDHAGRLADLDEALKLEPKQPDALVLKARLLSKLRQFDDAVQLLERALKAHPEPSLDLRRGMAVALYKSGRTEEAERAFAEIRSQSKQPVDFNNLCWDKATAGILLESALEDCRRALELRPDAPSYLDSLGMALLRLGRLDEAADAYARGLAKAPMPASLMGRAIIHALKGDHARATADRAAALKLDSDIESRFAEYGIEVPAAQKSLVER